MPQKQVDRYADIVTGIMGGMRGKELKQLTEQIQVFYNQPYSGSYRIWNLR